MPLNEKAVKFEAEIVLNPNSFKPTIAIKGILDLEHLTDVQGLGEATEQEIDALMLNKLKEAIELRQQQTKPNKNF